MRACSSMIGSLMRACGVPGFQMASCMVLFQTICLGFFICWLLHRHFVRCRPIVQPKTLAPRVKEGRRPRTRPRTAEINWSLPHANASLRYKRSEHHLESHWCAPPSDTTWRAWSENNDGLASRLPREIDGVWHVWCFCGESMEIISSETSSCEEFYCHCVVLADAYRRPAGCKVWKCFTCSATHSVADPATGQPRGIPASVACRALRYHGHALVDCIGSQRAYSFLSEGFHFSSAGVAASVHAVRLLRQALQLERRKALLKQRSDDAGIAALRKAAEMLTIEDAEHLLHGFAAAGQAGLVDELLQTGLCDVNAKRSKDGCTALHIAHYRNRLEVIAVLQLHGAGPAVRNHWGEIPEESARAAAHQLPQKH